MKSKINEINFITIQGWMYRLGLSNISEIVAYAIIYGYSQDGCSEFAGSLSYIQELLVCTRPTAIKIVKNLEEKGLIVKRQMEVSGVLFNRYIANLEVVKKFYYPENNLTGGSKNSLPQYINDNNKEKVIINNNQKEKTKPIINLSYVKEEFIPIMEEWIAYKKERRQSYTPRGLRQCYNNILTYSDGDPDVAADIILNAIGNNYQGFHPLKTNYQRTDSTQQWINKAKQAIEMARAMRGEN